MPSAMPTELYLLDVNALIALGWPQHVHHERAHAWFDPTGFGWATTPITETGFLRVSMTADVVGASVSAAEAIAALRRVRGIPTHRFLPDDGSLADAVIAGAPATRRQV